MLLDGEDIYDPARRPIESRRRIGMVFQKANPFPTMSVYDNVLAGLKLTGRTAASKGGADDLVEHSLRSAGLWDEVKARLGTPGSSLSGGQQQRLCIARALAVRPDVLLMDEPCSALDPTSTRRVEETIRAIAGEVTVVIVTHNMQQAQRVSDTLRVLPRGRGRSPATSSSRARPPRSSRTRATSAPPTTSTAGSDEPRHGHAAHCAAAGAGAPDRSRCRPTRSDRVFVLGARASAVATLVVMGLIGLFLLIGALPALKQQGWSFLTESQWLPEAGPSASPSLLWGTILIGLFALIVAVPVAFGAALFISEYAPRSLKKPLITLVDLMAAVPAVIYAIWALFFLQAQLLTVAQWLSVHFGGVLPFLRVNVPDSPSSYTSSAFIAGIAVGFVVLPTMTSVMREVFSQAPIGEREGAIALGATRWGMIRAGRPAVRPGRHHRRHHARPRPGARRDDRGLRDHLADVRVHDPPLRERHQHDRGAHRVRYSESSGVALSGLLGAGLVLFAFTLVINTLAGIVGQPVALRRGDGDLR